METNYKNKSMVDVAYDVIIESKRPLEFHELYKTVCEKLGVTEDQYLDRMSSFYTNLSFDGRLTNIQNKNIWDLKKNQKFDDSELLIVNEQYSDDEKEAKLNFDIEEHDEAELEDLEDEELDEEEGIKEDID